MLGGITSPEMIIYNNVLMDDESSVPPFGDCSIGLYLGGRPITLHNDTSDLEPIPSIDQYIDKLNQIKRLVNDVYQNSLDHPDTNYLVREFLNPPIPDTRLFGGTLLGHFHAKYKMFTLDFCDCSNKSRKTFNNDSMKPFVEKLTSIIDESLESVIEIRGMLK